MHQKLLLLLLVLLIAPAGSALAQEWVYQGAFPPDSSMTASIQGMAVLENGNVIVAPFSGGMFIYAPDGTPVDTVNTLTSADGDVDISGAGTRGVALAPDGTLLYAKGGLVYRVNLETGEALDVLDPQNGRPVAGPAVDAQGTIYQALVVEGDGPLRVYSPDFDFVENVVDTTRSFIRSAAVTAGGDAVYVGAYSGAPGAIWKYTRPDEFSPFGAADTLFRGVRSESLARNPSTGYIWFSNGVTASGAPDTLDVLTWYAVNPDTDEIVDSLQFNTGGVDPVAFATAPKPRALAFSTSGDTAYVGVFDTSDPLFVSEIATSVQVFVRSPILNPAVERTDDLPTTFALEGNYPNPFNPSTSVRFSLTTTVHATLKVYDPLGREVAVLVDERLTPGVYEAPFDAAGLASGAYLYVLEAEGRRQSRTMVLLK